MPNQESHLYEFGRYRLVPAERLLLLDGEPVPLTPKAFETLVALVRRGGRLVDKNELLHEVWPGTTVEESNIAQNIFALRRVLSRSDDGIEYIETVPKRGYRFLPPVVVREDGGELAAIKAGPSPAPVAPAPAALTVAVPASPRGLSRRALALAGGVIALVLVAATVAVTTLVPRSSVASPPSTIRISRLMSGDRIPSAAISPDGRYVAHVVERGNLASILVRQVSTLTDLPIVPTDDEAWYWGLSFSRDGDQLYYIKHVPGEVFNTLYRVSALGGAPKKVTAGVDSLITLSPDGRHIAFIREADGIDSVLVIANADGSAERALARRRRPESFFSGGHRGGPSWSPDGSMIATGVISLQGGYHGEIVTVSTRDGREQLLARRNWYQVAHVAWLPEGTGLLATARETAAAQIWYVPYPQGESRRVLTDLSDYHSISLTGDAKVLASVQHDRRSTLGFIPDRGSALPRRNTEGLDEGFYGLSWTPSGELVYASEASGNLDLWVVGADGVATRQLTVDPEHDSTPSVSPDGRSIVFISRRGGGNPHVWRMDSDGRNAKQLTNHKSEGTPSFTPDGQWVVYAVSGDGIWKVRATGGVPVPIARRYFHTPSISPDGSRIVCFYRDPKSSSPDQLAIIAMTGGALSQTLPIPERLSGPTIRWSEDGRSLVYIATHGRVSNLWTLPLDDSEPRQLTDFSSDEIFNFAWSRDHAQLAVARGTTSEHVVLIRDFR
jgi:Tol biopolymer transport system component/DNA-binding winged helix-turn-helix (wHTH) protein